MPVRLPAVLVVGSINMDLVLRTQRIPRVGETFYGKDYQHIPGGKGANQALACARLGAQVTFAGRVGRDAHGTRLREGLLREGVKTSYLAEDPEAKTGLAVIMVEEEGQNRILAFAGANRNIQEKDLRSAFHTDYEAVLLNLEIPPPIARLTCSLGRDKGIPVFLDAGPAEEGALQGIRDLEVLSPNENETQALTGIGVTSPADAAEAAMKLAKICPSRFIVIKMGMQGALLYYEGKSEHFPAPRVKAVDSTAAGDAFTAALTVHYRTHGNIREAVGFANLAGALSVTRLGAQPSLPTAREVAEFARALSSEMQ